jgi:indolepyruvate decarboxylase
LWYATSEHLRIGHHHYRDVRLDDFIRGLIDRNLKVRRTPIAKRTNPFAEVDMGTGSSQTTSPRVFARLNRLLAENRETTVIADVGDSLFGAMDLEMHRETEFLSPAYYASMGFSVPAAVGAGLANPGARVLVIVGDGAFQMTGMELSTIARHGLNPIVVVLNNHGYTTERLLLEGDFNDVHGWAFHKIPDVLGTGLGIEIRTMAELESGLARALANTSSFSLLNIHLDPLDHSPALDRLASKLSTIVDKKAEE